MIPNQSHTTEAGIKIQHPHKEIKKTNRHKAFSRSRPYTNSPSKTYTLKLATLYNKTLNLLRKQKVVNEIQAKPCRADMLNMIIQLFGSQKEPPETNIQDEYEKSTKRQTNTKINKKLNQLKKIFNIDNNLSIPKMLEYIIHELEKRNTNKFEPPELLQRNTQLTSQPVQQSSQQFQEYD